MVVLWGDPKSGEYAVLLKLPPGFTPGPHSHTGAYHGVNLQGTWTHIFGDDDVRSLPPSSYVMQPAESYTTTRVPVRKNASYSSINTHPRTSFRRNSGDQQD